MKAKVLATGEIIDVEKMEERVGRIIYVYYYAQSGESFQDYELEFLPDTPEEVIEGWMSRDFDGLIYLHKERPQLHEESGSWFSKQSLRLDNSCLPSITWDSSPKRVKITITPME